MTRHQFLDVTCPRCGAGIDEPCTTPAGKRTYRDHIERVSERLFRPPHVGGPRQGGDRR
ncbi:MAG: hypothetical protein QM638_01150 [Nocardioides sp.]|uniref:zinc finger domain-containing protein n=1 Tax=Nocardioides sp. TaxID=35761 RepID=UPI0039E445ED